VFPLPFSMKASATLNMVSDAVFPLPFSMGAAAAAAAAVVPPPGTPPGTPPDGKRSSEGDIDAAAAALTAPAGQCDGHSVH
jgi:hypothetical protein